MIQGKQRLDVEQAIMHRTLAAGLAALTIATATVAAAADTDQVVQSVKLKVASAGKVASVVRGMFQSAIAVEGDPKTKMVSLKGKRETVTLAMRIIAAVDVNKTPLTGGLPTARVYDVKPGLIDNVVQTLKALVPDSKDATIAIAPSRKQIVVLGDASVLTTFDTLVPAITGENNEATTHATYIVKNAIPNPVASGSSAGTSTVQDLATAASNVMAADGSFGVKISASSSLPRIVVTGTQPGIDRTLKILDELDQAPALIELEATFLEYDELHAHNVGFNIPSGAIQMSVAEYFPPVGSATTATPSPALLLGKLTKQPLSLQAQINLLVSSGLGRLSTQPRVATLSGRLATISVTDNIPFVSFGQVTNGFAAPAVFNYQTGTKLEIVSIANPDGSITAFIHPNYSTLTTITAQGAPQISTRDSSTTLRLKEGQSVIISGLKTNLETSTVVKTPPLSYIPLIGHLFNQKVTQQTYQDLIIILKPTVLDYGGINTTESLFGSPPPKLPRGPGLPAVTPVPFKAPSNKPPTPTPTATPTP